MKSFSWLPLIVLTSAFSWFQAPLFAQDNRGSVIADFELVQEVRLEVEIEPVRTLVQRTTVDTGLVGHLAQRPAETPIIWATAGLGAIAWRTSAGLATWSPDQIVLFVRPSEAAENATRVLALHRVALSDEFGRILHLFRKIPPSTARA